MSQESQMLRTLMNMSLGDGRSEVERRLSQKDTLARITRICEEALSLQAKKRTMASLTLAAHLAPTREPEQTVSRTLAWRRG